MHFFLKCKINSTLSQDNAHLNFIAWYTTQKLSIWSCITLQEFVCFSSLIPDSFVSSFSYHFLGKRRLHILYYAIHFTEEDIASLLPSYCSIFSKSKEHFVTRTHILQSGLRPLGSLPDYVTRFSEWMWHIWRKNRSGHIFIGYKCITAYMYKNIKAYLYVSMRMCWCVSMRTH